jgi:GTPase SAR1 family protein
MIIDWSSKVIQTKVVYYGPAMSGKTTSIRSLFKKFNQSQKIESIETTTGRTLFFDFGALDLHRDNWTLRVYIWSATGQDYYAETRPTVVKGTDGIVFVADVQPHLLNDNLRSWQELRDMFGDKLGDYLPVVIQMNKWDLPDAITRQRLAHILGLDNGVHVFQTIAPEGYNISETFATIIQHILRKV